MKEKIPIERLLKYHFPFLENNRTLPFNYRFTMHYTKSEVNEKGISVHQKEEIYEIKIPNLQCKMSEFSVFYKPISRIFDTE